MLSMVIPGGLALGAGTSALVDGSWGAPGPWALVALGGASIWNGLSLWPSIATDETAPARRSFSRVFTRDRTGSSPTTAAARVSGSSSGARPVRVLPYQPDGSGPVSAPSLRILPPPMAAGSEAQPAQLVQPIVGPAFGGGVDLELEVVPSLLPSVDIDTGQGAPVGVGPGTDGDTRPGLVVPEAWDLGAPPDASSWLDVEARIPVPPHLRTAPALAPSPALTPPVHGRPGTEGSPRCSTCSARMEGSEGWHRCTHCRRPLCVGCIVETLAASGRGWCAHCAALSEFADAHLAS